MTAWWWKLLKYAKPHRRGIVLVGFCMLAAIGAQLLMPWPLKLLVDYVLGDQVMPDSLSALAALSAEMQVLLLAFSTVALFVVRHGIGLFQTYIQSTLGSRMTYDLGGDLYNNLQRLSLSFHGGRRTGDLVRRVTADSICIRQLVMGVLLPATTSLLMLAVMFAVMWQLNTTLTLVAVCFAVPIAFLVRIGMPRMNRRAEEQQEVEAAMYSLQEETLSAVPIIQAFQREPAGDQNFVTMARDCARAYVELLKAQLQFRWGVEASTTVGTALIMGLGGVHVLAGELTLGSLLVILAYLASLYAPMQTLALMTQGYANAAARAKRVLDVLEYEDNLPEVQGAPDLDLSATAPTIRFEQVSFAYRPGQPVLEGVDFEINSGETVALAGASGAGKTTIAMLLARFYDPAQGRILIGHQSLREVTLASVRRNVSVVLQESFLLPISVAQNIAYGKPGAGRDEIVAAAKAANAHDFITALPDGYDTIVGAIGQALSGGEAQRLAVARALLKDARVLILDESTSALDSESEGAVLEALDRLRENRTTLIIAHRLSSLRAADRILVIDGARVVQSGPYRELISRDGPFRRMYDTDRPAREASV